MRLCSASETGSGETNKSLFCPLCTPQGSPLVYAVCLRQDEKRELKPLCLDRDKMVIADFTGLFALRHSGTVHPSHRCAARSLGGGKSRQLAEENLCFHWHRELYFGCNCLHVEENPLVGKRGLLFATS